ncbi:MAG: hypothetical protein A2268_05600 [Candidatus Raymondbacteria bacterium RifOxyA12_full_50_37]|uniref:Glycosyl transferase family 1 domain-containing protein n=1 Tax=Candidatus Raymondbacteria bacterium RIFOXYD12_FULL_49_13 TaxID=1817890 RepID=A0A1F7F5I6_UNCRA|nr:MAG: hypothetical protein A2268_05600 [Candidatus Raymondbacteria bacterium RifOxyA12_full_50_37]OGJ89039.1 MAG: hypothetical protein A2248_02835 [Candidatus Raymondbacteria bacterium RIFOXYA2_FULL_49_16]OGJ93802.1 MAG: hypothetical protein A2350_06575 [Candidatus Raymondbacteria bacterium RifOxyB12_full_50_8]OGJ97066.1 MAG: hypothetical protein A2453_04250 [Candidatus Raymondbacteria bacterium RIFOXYC2_FULL_50_21]OGK01776.1 MAG: hypothetical protein A2519_01695 [Candidatus Raymondbacteria b
MAVIAFTQHRLGRTDGVSLEVDKWRVILERMGHTVHYISGNEDVPGGHCIPELYPFHPITQKVIKNGTRKLSDYNSSLELMAEVEAQAARIKPQFLKHLRDLKVELLFPNNLVSVGYNLPGMQALVEAVDELHAERGLRVTCHNHDFWWEDSGEVEPTCAEVAAHYRKYAPPIRPYIHHMVINRIAQAELKRRTGQEARVVPNVFDFDRPAWTLDAYNADFRNAIGVRETDLVFLQATRILDRKGVELAIDLIAELQKPENRVRLEAGPLYHGRSFGKRDRIVLVCAGYVEGIGLTGTYPEALKTKAAEMGVEVVWCATIVKHSRGAEEGRKIYSLWDSYAHADFVTYPSVWEGWGNQFIEAVFTKLPVCLFEYPVWTSDLAQCGFDVVSLGNQVSGTDKRNLVTVEPSIVRRAAGEVIALLRDGKRRTQVVEKNYAIARENFSLHALERIIRDVLEKQGIS